MGHPSQYCFVCIGLWGVSFRYNRHNLKSCMGIHDCIELNLLNNINMGTNLIYVFIVINNICIYIYIYIYLYWYIIDKSTR